MYRFFSSVYMLINEVNEEKVILLELEWFHRLNITVLVQVDRNFYIFGISTLIVVLGIFHMFKCCIFSLVVF